MTEKFTYWIDFGTGFQQVTILDNQLELIFKVHDEWQGVIINELTGSFVLQGANFDSIVSILNNTGNVDIPINIYETVGNSIGNLIYNGAFNTFNDFDYNIKKVKINQFKCQSQEQRFIQDLLAKLETCEIVEDSYTALGYHSLNSIAFASAATPFGRHFIDFAQIVLSGGGVNPVNAVLDGIGGDHWMGAAGIDLDKLMICKISHLVSSFGGIYEANYSDFTFHPVNTKEFLEFMQIAFQAYWTIDGLLLKFKTVDDFSSNTLNVTAYNSKMDRKVYNYALNFSKEVLKLHNNNNSGTLMRDFEDNGIDYNRISNSESKIYEATKFMTKYDRTMGINLAGWFICYVDQTTFDIDHSVGFVSGVNRDNAKLSQANLLDTYYRQFLYTKRQDFDVCQITAPDAPIFFRPFVELPDFPIILDSVATFYDSLLWKVDGVNQIIARVKEQKTNLKTGLTVFKSHEFVNEIN